MAVARQDSVAQVLLEAMAWLKDYITAVKHGRIHPFTVIERKARAATRNEPWGPTGTMLAELAELSQDAEQCQIIFAVLEYRIKSPEHKWRCAYKALQVLEYLIKRGSPQCCAAASDLVVPLAALQNFAFVGPDGRDYGLNVRMRAEAVKAFILDAEGLAQQRAQLAARAGNMKFAGFSREDMSGGSCSPGLGPGPPGLGWTSSTEWGDSAAFSSSGGDFETPAAAFGEGADATAQVAATTAAGPWRPGASAGAGCEGPRAGSPTPYRPPLFLTVPAARLNSTHSPAARGAGESKGVTFEQNKRQLEQLRQLTMLEGNRTCADCASNTAAARPTWAAINLGVFICMRCAGIHRGLGVHVSKVRSTTLDTWLPEQVETMARLGNKRANAHFEAELQPSMRPARDNTIELERFIRLKYADKVWAAKGPWPPEDEAQPPAHQMPGVGPPAASVVGPSPAAGLHRRVSSAMPASGLLAGLAGPQLPAAAAAAAALAGRPGSAGGGTPSSSSGFPASWPPQGPSGKGHGHGPAAVAGPTGGGFGDAPPAWPDQGATSGPPASGASAAASTQAQFLPQESWHPWPETRQGCRPVQGGPTAGAAAAPGVSSVAAAVGRLPPPPSGPRGPTAGKVDLLLAMDSDSEEDGEDASGEGARQGGAGGPTSAAAALWDLLDPSLDVMTWLDRVEGAQQQQQHQLQGQARGRPAPLDTPPAATTTAAAATPFDPAFPPAQAAVPAAPPAGQAAPAASSTAVAAAGGTPTPGLASAEASVIMTAEFPVYDLLTPLPTVGPGGAMAPPAATSAPQVGGLYGTPSPFLAAQSLQGTTPPGSSHPHPAGRHPHPYVNSAPPCHPTAAAHLVYGGSLPYSRPAPGTATTTTTAAVTTATNTSGGPLVGGGRLAAPAAGMPVRPAASGASATAPLGGGAAMRGLRAGGGNASAAGAPTAGASTAVVAAALDLDNLLALQLDSLGSSLADPGGPNSKGGVGPSWKPAAASGPGVTNMRPG